MSLKTGFVKIAIKLTPNKLVIWVANIVLKDVAKLTQYMFDIDTRRAFIEIQLDGESETIDVGLEGFAVIVDEGSYKFVIQNAHSNRRWLNTILSRVASKAWKIPETSQTAFVAELLKGDSPVRIEKRD